MKLIKACAANAQYPLFPGRIVAPGDKVKKVNDALANLESDQVRYRIVLENDFR